MNGRHSTVALLDENTVTLLGGGNSVTIGGVLLAVLNEITITLLQENTVTLLGGGNTLD